MRGARNRGRKRGYRRSLASLRMRQAAQLVLACWMGLGLLWAPFDAYAQAPAAPAADTAAEIVYIDANGFIRVHDPSGAPLAAWVSPTGGWYDAALGDFNNDGEAEIVAVGGQGSGGKLAVFDPVVAVGMVHPNQSYNGLYWETLYELAFPATPHLVATGAFDPNSAGSEIVAVHDLPDDAGFGARGTRVVILSQRSANPDGRQWQLIAELSTSTPWSDIATGDLEASGIDNLVLIDEDDSQLSIFRLSGASLVRYYNNQSESRPWNDAVIGQVDPATPQPELVLVRNADPELPSLIVWRYDGKDGFADVYLQSFLISPRVVFLANITGAVAGAVPDEEIFMLRNVTRTAPCASVSTTPPQLFMRNRGADRPIAFEVCLDQSNVFRYGAGGDLDGDGKDEVAVISPAQLRIFNSPDTRLDDITNVPVSSNARTIVIGDLDRNGSARPDTLGSTPLSRIDVTMAAGESGTVYTTEIVNSTNARSLPIVVRGPSYAPFLRWSLDGTQTPARLAVTVDASELLPGGAYGANLQVISGRERVANSPLEIPVLVRTTAGVILRPAGTTVVVSPCSAPATPPTVTFNVWGTAGSEFTGEVRPHGSAAAADAGALRADWPHNGVPWVASATSLTGTTPSAITLTLDVSKATGFDQADVLVMAMAPGVGAVQRRAVVNLVCTEHVLYLPTIGR